MAYPPPFLKTKPYPCSNCTDSRLVPVPLVISVVHTPQIRNHNHQRQPKGPKKYCVCKSLKSYGFLEMHESEFRGQSRHTRGQSRPRGLAPAWALEGRFSVNNTDFQQCKYCRSPPHPRAQLFFFTLFRGCCAGTSALAPHTYPCWV